MISRRQLESPFSDKYCETMEEVFEELRRRREARSQNDLVLTRYEKTRYGGGFRVYSVPAELVTEEVSRPLPTLQRRRLFAGKAAW